MAGPRRPCKRQAVLTFPASRSTCSVDCKAAAQALSEFPGVNGAYRDGKYELYSRINSGLAVAAQGALVATVFDADKKPLVVIAQEARALIDVRDGEITPPEHVANPACPVRGKAATAGM